MSNVFGKIINDDIVKGMQTYVESKEKLKDSLRAQAAYEMIGVDNKDFLAAKYLDELEAQEKEQGTKVMLYNATGNTLTLEAIYDSSGNVGSSPYPYTLHNGQWGVFFHRMKNNESRGALVYEGKCHPNGQKGEWKFGWQNDGKNNSCFTECQDTRVRKVNRGDFNALSTGLDSVQLIHTSTQELMRATATMGNTKNPIFQGIMTLKGVL